MFLELAVVSVGGEVDVSRDVVGSGVELVAPRVVLSAVGEASVVVGCRSDVAVEVWVGPNFRKCCLVKGDRDPAWEVEQLLGDSSGVVEDDRCGVTEAVVTETGDGAVLGSRDGPVERVSDVGDRGGRVGEADCTSVRSFKIR